MQLQENTLFANRYQLLKLLGRGGFSEVWLAKDNWTHLEIAIKVYAPGQGMDQNGLQEFCGELARVYDLNHTNLLKPQHVDTWENMPYLIMAYCSAGSCLKRVGKMSEDELWKLIRDVASGLAYLHEKDIVHQDIKPDNILINEEGHFLITDFGISTRARSTLRKSVIGSNTSGGTTAYMGPERFSHQPAPTKASDIWSFGAMAFELLEGVTPFGEIGGGMQKGGAEIPYINTNVTDALKQVIYKMLSKDTWDRPTASTLVEWANNPSSIKIEDDLLTNEKESKLPNQEQLTSNSTGRKTQRFGNSNSVDEMQLNLSVNPKEINVPAAGGRSTISVNTNGEWVLPKASTQQWIHTHKESKESFTIKFEPNKTGKLREYILRIPTKNDTNTIHEDIVIKQPALVNNPKKWLWLLLLILPISCVVVFFVKRESQRNEILSAHSSAVSSFEQSLRDAGMENLVAFEEAVDCLSSIRYNENQSLFNGLCVYPSKKEKLKSSLESVYNELDRKCQVAPYGTDLEQKLKNKRDKVNNMIQQL